MSASSKSPAFRPLLMVVGFIAAVVAIAFIATGTSGFGMWVLLLGGLYAGITSSVRLILARDRG